MKTHTLQRKYKKVLQYAQKKVIGMT